jgi:hypothetical protein
MDSAMDVRSKRVAAKTIAVLATGGLRKASFARVPVQKANAARAAISAAAHRLATAIAAGTANAPATMARANQASANIKVR